MAAASPASRRVAVAKSTLQRVDEGADPGHQHGQSARGRVGQLPAGPFQVARGGLAVPGQAGRQRGPAVRPDPGGAVHGARDPAPARRGVQQRAVGGGGRGRHPGRPRARVAAGGQHPVGRGHGRDRVPVAPGLFGQQPVVGRLGRRAGGELIVHRQSGDHHVRAPPELGVYPCWPGGPRSCMYPDTLEPPGRQHWWVTAQPRAPAGRCTPPEAGRCPAPGAGSAATMPSQLRTTTRQASTVLRLNIGFTACRCQRSSAAKAS